MKILFLDESGDHNLSVIDPDYPLFVLGGVIVDQYYAETVLEQKLNLFKSKVFGTTNIILHTADITRNRNGFEKLISPEFRLFFYSELNRLMSEIEYQVVACVVKKEKHLSQYGVAALDPYLLSLDILVERLGFEVGRQGVSGLIVAEKRDPNLDYQLDLAWMNLKISGTKYLSATDIQRRVSGLNLRAKSENIAGLQLADLAVSPIGRHVLGKTDKEDYKIIESKFRSGPNGQFEGYGLVILPRR